MIVNINCIFYRKLSTEMMKLYREVDDIITKNMMIEKHKVLLYFEYKEFSKQLAKFCDLIEIFSQVNSELLKQDEIKKKLGKRTRRPP